MKKKIIIFLLLLLIPLGVKADTIKSIDMRVYIDESGNANVEEKWYVKANTGSEWYKTMYNLGNSEITNLKVSMDGEELTLKSYWNVSESISDKAGYYGINNTSSGPELCFGKTDYKWHTFTLTYDVSNYIFNTSDSQVLYFTLMPEISVEDFTATITSYYSFPDTLDVWGYGYKGYAYVNDGKINIMNEDALDSNYVTLLVKFPLNTFETNNSYSQFTSFNDVYTKAEEGTFDYNYVDYYQVDNYLSNILTVISIFTSIIPIFIIGFINVALKENTKYGYKDNKTITKENTNMFRDIPCNKDIYYANALTYLNDFNYKETNIMGAIILKWVKEDKVRFIKSSEDKEKSSIDLTLNPTFSNTLEKDLFDIMYTASKDGILETNELESWCKKNYNEFFKVFEKFKNNEVDKLKTENRIYTRTNKEECKYKNILDDKIYNDSKELYGLKLYLEEFSQIDTKEVMEVKIWDEYLMFAYIFGIADKVAEQLKKLYPQVLAQTTEGTHYFDYDTIIILNHISTRSVNAAYSARVQAARDYSSGGGGFSSGGGGGGSFGGGGHAGGR